MGSVANIVVTIRVDNQGVGPALAKTKSDLDAATKGFRDLGDEVRRMGQEISRVGSIMTLGLTAPIVAMATASVKAFAELELNVRRVTSLLSETGEVADKSFQNFYEGVRKTSVALGVDMVGSAKALYEIISTGIPKESALNFLDTATKAGIAGLSDTKTAVNALTTVINAYGLETNQAKEVSDALFMAVNKGKFTFEQLSSSLAHSMPIASQLGVKYKEILGAASQMSLQGFTVNQSMIRIAQSMNALLKPTKQLNELYKKLGVEGGKELIEKSGGLTQALQKLRDAAGGNEAVLSKSLGRYQAFQALLSLTGDNAKRTGQLIGDMNNSLGATDIAFGEIDKSFSRTWDKLKAQFQDVKISIGEALEPVMMRMMNAAKGMLESISKAVEGFKKLPPELQNAAIGFIAVVAAAGPVLWVFGQLITAVGTISKLFSAPLFTGLAKTMGGLSGSVQLLGKAFVVLTVALAAIKASDYVGEWNGLADVMKGLWSVIQQTGHLVINVLKAAFDALVVVLVPVVAGFRLLWNVLEPLLGGGLALLGQGLKVLAEGFEFLSQFLQGLAALLGDLTKDLYRVMVTDMMAIGDLIGGIWDNVKQILVNVWTAIKTAASELWGSIKQYFVDLWDGIFKSSEDVWGPIARFLIDIWNTLKAAVTNTFKGLGETVGSIWNLVKGKLAEIGAGFASLAASIVQGMKDIAKYSSGMDKANIDAMRSINDLRKSAIDAENFFKGVSASAAKGSKAYNEALLKMLESQANLKKALKEPLSKELAKQIEDLRGELNKAGRAFDEAGAKADPGLTSKIAKVVKLTKEQKEEIKQTNEFIKTQTNLMNKYEDSLRETIKKRKQYWEDFANDIGVAAKEWRELMRKIDEAAAKESIKKVFPKEAMDEAARTFASMTKTMGDVGKAFDTLNMKSSNSIMVELDNYEAAFKKLANLTEEQRKANFVSLEDMARAEKAYLSKKLEAYRAVGQALSVEEMGRLKALEDTYKDVSTTATKEMNKIGKFGKEVSLIVNDLTRDFAQAILKGRNFGEVMTKAFEAIKEAILRLFIKDTLEQMMKSIGLTEIKLGSLFNKIGEWLGFGKGKTADLPKAVEAAATAATNAAAAAAKTADIAKTAAEGAQKAGEISKTAADASKSAATAVQGAAAAATSAMMSAMMVISTISAVISAITGVLMYLQGRRMEQDIGRIEVTTRGILNQVIAHQETFNKYLPMLQGIVDFAYGVLAPSFASLMSTVEESRNTLNDILLELRKGLKFDTPTGSESTTETIEDLTEVVEDLTEVIEEEGEAREETVESIEDLTGATQGLVEVTKKLAGETYELADGTKTTIEKQYEWRRGMEGAAEATESYVSTVEYAGDKMLQVANSLSSISFTELREAAEDVWSPYDKKNGTGTPGAFGIKEPDWASMNKPITEAVKNTTGVMMGPIMSAGTSLASLAAELNWLNNKSLSTPLTLKEFERWTQLNSLKGMGLSMPEMGKMTPYSYSEPPAATAVEPVKTEYNLNVQVNNADAGQIANTIVGTFRQRGVDF